MSTIEAVNTRQLKRRRRRQSIAEGCVVGLMILGCVIAPVALLGLVVFVVRFAWTLGGSL